MAETFIVESDVSAFIMAGDGDRVVFLGDFSDYNFKQLGSQLHILSGRYSTFVNIGGKVVLETDNGSVDVHMDFDEGAPLMMLGGQSVGANNFDIEQLTFLSNAV
jgi:hypothetical protein